MKKETKQNLNIVLKEMTPFLIVINATFVNMIILKLADFFNSRFATLSILLFGSYMLFTIVIWFYDRHIYETGG